LQVARELVGQLGDYAVGVDRGAREGCRWCGGRARDLACGVREGDRVAVEQLVAGLGVRRRRAARLVYARGGVQLVSVAVVEAPRNSERRCGRWWRDDAARRDWYRAGRAGTAGRLEVRGATGVLEGGGVALVCGGYRAGAVRGFRLGGVPVEVVLVGRFVLVAVEGVGSLECPAAGVGNGVLLGGQGSAGVLGLAGEGCAARKLDRVAGLPFWPARLAR
jgi:hypothetical protein